MTPSGYLTKMLSEIQDRYYPTRNQLRVLAVFAEHLDNVKCGKLRALHGICVNSLFSYFLGQGGAATPGWVQEFIARVVAYAFGADEAIRM